ncbi:MAG: hypothetical protein DWQ05_17905 [Calditrichaeota bacterium]|nr:MAG: hypothetical protein DWQ05_17905 [Calditrichota bacterium]
MQKMILPISCLCFILLTACAEKNTRQPVYKDVPYLQDYAIKFYADSSIGELKKVATDRNGVVQVLASNGLYRPNNGHFQYPGKLSQDRSYRPMADKEIRDIAAYKNQFVYLDEVAVFSNAWAGKLFSRHGLSTATQFCGGPEFAFLLANETKLFYVKDSKLQWQGNTQNGEILAIKYNETAQRFYILTEKAVYSFFPKKEELMLLFEGEKLTCFEIAADRKNLVIGTLDGYFSLDAGGRIQVDIENKLPWPELTCITEIDGRLWFGSTKGAFMLRDDGKFNYYFGERWLPGKIVKHISAGPEISVLILTDKGLGQICFKKMTLEEKAMIYEKQVRQRQIRYGINSQLSRLENHDLSTTQNRVADSDNLWTGMYLGSQLFRYLATGSEEAKENCYEAFEAMERMHEINGIEGLFGRSFERRGYHEFRQEFRDYVNHYWYEGYQGTVSWRHADDPEWDWRASASSDQTVGQIFALTLIAEYIDDDDWRGRAIKLLDGLMSYIVENDLCLIDYNGKPSLWGRWNPEYVNRFETMIGDRKICSSNIIAFLQTAYKFTGKEIFKNKAFELLNEHGYLENLMRPFAEIGPAPAGADGWSALLSEEWNHSDDEMYFLAYWGLYPYAFNDSLQEKYRTAIKDHWQWERPEKNALWNFCYAMTGATEFDLDASIWHLKEFPLDMIQFEVENSHRKDIEFVESNFWGQTTSEVLPPDERPELKHNRSLFKLDAGDRHSELSAGDTFLLPYWMGRFLGVISAPVGE